MNDSSPAGETEYRGRFAPSPTGPLHAGSLYTALAGFLQARAANGRWLLRIDDLDPHRTVPGMDDRIRYALETLSLHWDGPILYQSRRTAHYAAALAELKTAGWVYPCLCSRRQIASVSDENPASLIYPGLCRNRKPESTGSPHTFRILTEGIRISFRDTLQGLSEQNLETEVGDFVLFRRDGVYAYHLATVLDDTEQGISEVLRGVDLLDSTPRQIYLQQQLGLPTPAYAHIPVLVDGQGRKLGKQTFAPEPDLRNPGGVLFRLLTLLRQNPPAELAPQTPAEILAWAVAHWDLSRLQGVRRIPVEGSQSGLPASLSGCS